MPVEILLKFELSLSEFKIEHFDHVAIRAINPEKSIKWYADVIGLKEIRAKAWGAYPVFMVSGETGVAIFPADENGALFTGKSSSTGIDHFAFRLDNENFLIAQAAFKKSNIPFQFKDHTYFHSMYLKDPDNHTVELTTLLVDPKQFYKL